MSWTPYRLRRLKPRKPDGTSRLTATDTRTTNIRVGDVDAGNYVKIDENGITHYGNATHWDDIRINANAIKLRGSGDPDYSEFPSGTGLYTYLFDGASTTEQVYFTVQLPHGYKAGTDLKPHVHYSPTDNAATGYVKFSLDYLAASVNGTMDATESTVSGTDAVDLGAIRKHLICALDDIDGTGLTESAMLLCRLYRDPTDGDDTVAYDVAFLEFDLHYQIEKPGTVDEYPS